MKRVFRKGFLCLEIPEDKGIREALKKILVSCRDKYNDFVQVTIKPPYRPRTTGANSQNHHLNGHIVQLCNIGNNPGKCLRLVKQIVEKEMKRL